MPIHRLSPLAIALCGSLISCPILAQEAELVAMLPNIEVEDLRVALDERRESVNQKIVIDGVDLTRYGNGSLGDALRRMNGFHFGGPPGENRDLRLRGLDKEYSQVLIDGRRFPDSGEKREVELDKIPLSMVDRIEIIRSPDASMDSQGIGGTVNIVLKKRGIDERQAVFGYSNGDSRPNDGTAQFNWGQSDETFQWMLSGGRQTRSTPKEKSKDTYTAKGAYNGGEREYEDKRYFENYFNPHLSWTPNDNERFSLSLHYLESNQYKDKIKDKLDAKRAYNGSETEDEQVDSKNFGFDLGWDHRINDDTTLDSYLNLRILNEEKDKDKLTFNKANKLTKTEVEQEDKHDREWQFGQKLRYRFNDQHDWLTGFDSSRKTRDKDKTKTSAGVVSSGEKDNYEITEERLDLFFSDTWKINANNTLQTGLRWENTRLEQEVPYNGERDSDESFLIPSLHYRLQLAEDLLMRASFARTVRRPKFDDIIPSMSSNDGSSSSSAISIGNPSLRAEKAWSYDLGFEQYFGNQGVVGLNFFFRDVRNYMESITSLGSDGLYYSQVQNIGDGKTWGAELDFNSGYDWLGIPGLRANAGYNWLDSSIRDQITGRKRRFKQQPGYLANLGLEYMIPGTPITIGGSWNKSGDYEDEETLVEAKRQGRIEYIDLFLNANLTKELTLKLSAENIAGAEKDEKKFTYNNDGSYKGKEKTNEKSEPLYTATVVMRW